MFLFQSFPNPSERTWGKTSRVPHTNYHVLFLDYDSIDQLTLNEEIEALQNEHKFGDVYVFSSGRENAFHCVCLDYFTVHEIRRIGLESSCDIGFVLAPRLDRFRNWVLRDATKGSRTRPAYLSKIQSAYEGFRKQSGSHADFLRKYYCVPIELKNDDGKKDEILVETYLTAKRLDKNRE